MDRFQEAPKLARAASAGVPAPRLGPGFAVMRADHRDEVALEPDRAVRARLNAAIIDVLLVGALVRVLVAALGMTTLSPGTLALIYGMQFLYFFGCEASTGRTIGKRAMKVRVIALDGSPASLRMHAVRNAMRFVDALPLLYTSGLVSLIRTGRARRQRLGDIVAGTTVAIDGPGTLRTPRWLLPAATVVASLASLGVITQSAAPPADRERPPGPLTVPGFAGGASVAPRPGFWRATGVVTSSHGYGGPAGVQPVGHRVERLWKIVRTCGGRRCRLVLIRQTAAGPPLAAELVRHSDGWHAAYVKGVSPCRWVGRTPVAWWTERSYWVLRFGGGGTTVEARERNLSHTPECGWATDTLAWTGGHA